MFVTCGAGLNHPYFNKKQEKVVSIAIFTLHAGYKPKAQSAQASISGVETKGSIYPGFYFKVGSKTIDDAQLFHKESLSKICI